MPISLDGSGSISGISTFSFSDEIIHTGDTNTAIKFPANDTISFETSGNERLRIASDGKIGFGDFSSGTSLSYPLHLKNAMGSSPSFIHMEVTGSNTVGGGGGIAFDTSASNNASSNTLYLATIAGIRNSDDDGSNDLVFSTSKNGVNSNLPTERFRITSSGRVLIGKTSGDHILDINASSDEIRLTKASLSDYTGIQLDRDASGNAGGYFGLAGNTNHYITGSAQHDICVRSEANLVFSAGGGTEALRIDSNGYLIARGDIRLRRTPSNNGALYFGDTNNNYIFGSDADDLITFATAGTERLRINSDGRVLIGDGTPENTIGLNARVQTFGTDASTSGVAIRRGSNDAQAAFLVMSKSRNTAVGSRTILQNGDEVGNIFFAADDGTDLVSNTAAIKSQINGTPGANDTPGNLSFWTTSDGANSATQRMTIDSVGRVSKPYQFHIVVARSGNQSSYNPSQGFGTGIVYNTVVTTQGTDSSILDTSNGRVTVPIDGIYFLEGSGYSDSAVFTQGWFTKNGGRLSYSDFMNNSGNSQNVNSVGFHKLSANDTIGFKAYGSGSTSTTVVATANHTWMRITLVG